MFIVHRRLSMRSSTPAILPKLSIGALSILYSNILFWVFIESCPPFLSSCIPELVKIRFRNSERKCPTVQNCFSFRSISRVLFSWSADTNSWILAHLNFIHKFGVETVKTKLIHHIAAEPLRKDEANLMRFSSKFGKFGVRNWMNVKIQVFTTKKARHPAYESGLWGFKSIAVNILFSCWLFIIDSSKRSFQQNWSLFGICMEFYLQSNLKMRLVYSKWTTVIKHVKRMSSVLK